jgi:DNA polymerase I-like protein with 3'-5' exonuclease and polymerase domains
MIEFDVETDGLQPWSGVQRAFSMQFWDGDDPRGRESAEFLVVGTTGIHTANPQHIERVQYWLDRAKQEGIRAHNTKFDRAFGDVTLPELDWPGDGMWHDSMVVAQTINERRSLKLKDLGDTLLGDGQSSHQKELQAWLTKERARRAKIAKAEGTELVEPTYADVPLELIVPYGLEDVFIQYGISNQMQPVLDHTPDLQAVVDFERKVLDALYAVEKRGLPADRSGYVSLMGEVTDNLDRLEDAPQRLAAEGDLAVYNEQLGRPEGAEFSFNVNSSAQVIAALKARGADMQFMATTDGKIKSADRENLEAVDDLLAEAMLEYRSEYKVLSTYVRPYVQRHYDTGLRAWKEPFVSHADDRIHATYRQVGARTGRMSCADPNMQNQPRDDLRLRYNIRAEEGHVLVACDLSNIEMRLFAAYAGDGRLLKAVRDGADLHTMTAKFIGIKDRKRASGYIESARQRGKTFNFSIIYGGGLRTIRRQQRVNTADARLMRNRYYDAYPEVKVLQNRIEWKLSEQGYIKDMWGRRYRCDNAQKEAYKFTNYLIQGTAAEVLKDALVTLHQQKVPVVALVHDEIIAHVPREDAEEVAHLIEQAMTQQARPGGHLWLPDKNAPIVPLDAEAEIIDRWSQAKDPDFVPAWAAAA